MAYLDNLFGAHINRLERGLDKTAQRQTMLMRNLANVNVPGYKRQDIDFHVALDEALGNSSNDGFQFKPRGPQNIGGGASLRQDGNNVDMEAEVVSIAQNENHFNELAEFTSRYFSGLKNVIKEGR